MKRALKLLLISAMLALIPLRGLAAVTVGICAASGHASTIQLQADHDHGEHEHTPAPHSHDGNKVDCGACAEHCTGASFVAQAVPTSLLAVAGTERAAKGERFSAGHVPEHLDPPPLAL